MVPIIAFNYGAQNRKRIEKTVRLSVIIALCIMAFGTVLFWVFPRALLSLFNASDALVQVGVPMLRIVSLCFPFAAVGIVFSSCFQALGKGLYSLLMSIIRQLVVLLPLAWLLARFTGLDGLWFGPPIAEAVCVVVAIFLFRYTHKHIIAPLPAGAP